MVSRLSFGKLSLHHSWLLPSLFLRSFQLLVAISGDSASDAKRSTRPPTISAIRTKCATNARPRVQRLPAFLETHRAHPVFLAPAVTCLPFSARKLSRWTSHTFVVPPPYYPWPRSTGGFFGPTLFFESPHIVRSGSSRQAGILFSSQSLFQSLNSKSFRHIVKALPFFTEFLRHSQASFLWHLVPESADASVGCGDQGGLQDTVPLPFSPLMFGTMPYCVPDLPTKALFFKAPSKTLKCASNFYPRCPKNAWKSLKYPPNFFSIEPIQRRHAWMKPHQTMYGLDIKDEAGAHKECKTSKCFQSFLAKKRNKTSVPAHPATHPSGIWKGAPFSSPL